MENKFIKFIKSTTAKILSSLFILALVGGYFLFPDFYKEQAKKVVSYYWVYKGDKYYKNKEPQKAIYSYQKGLEYYPKHFKAQYNLANIYVSYEDYYSALSAYEKALQIKPDSINARIDYAIVLAEATFNYDKAIEEYDKAIKLSPKWVYIPFIVNSKNTYKYNRGVAFYNLGLAWRGKSLLMGDKNFDSRKFLNNAAESYSNALKIKQNYQTFYNLGIVYHILKYPYMAGYNYCMAIEKAPMNYEAHYNLGILLREYGQYNASLEEFHKASLILDIYGDASKNQYIYDILNDVTRRIVAKGNHDALVDALKLQDKKVENHLVYKGGRAYLDENYERTMYKYFKTCALREHFVKNKDNVDIQWK
ncbi:MAG: tetratricopeptide repeat protein [Cyanobacteria bacterium SIG30]|nr:tetratricopeptide repeat protein [Cyanobacteria bacterium SIG30]